MAGLLALLFALNMARQHRWFVRCHPVGADGAEFLFPTSSQVHRLLVYQPNGTVASAESTLTVIAHPPRDARR